MVAPALDDAASYRISRLGAEFTDPATEAAFREHIHPIWVRDTRLAVTLSALFYLVFAITDYLALGAGEPYTVALLTRLLVCALGLGIAYTAHRFWRPLVDGLTPTLVEAVALAGFLSITLLRPYEPGWHGMSLMVMLLGVYVFIPNRFLPTLLVAGSTTLAFIWLIDQHFQLATAQFITLSLLLLAINLFGAMSARRVSRLRREAWRDDLQLRAGNRALTREIEERQRLEAHLRDLAHQDDLTGLPNRRRFLDLAESALEAARRQDAPAALMLMEVDYYKQITDTYGRVLAEAVLQGLVAVCRRHLRGRDLLARAGAEAFAVLLPQTEPAAARELAERLRQEVLRTPASLAEAPVHYSITLGLAQWRPAEGVGALMHRADEALHAARLQGGNRVGSAAALEAVAPGLQNPRLTLDSERP